MCDLLHPGVFAVCTYFGFPRFLRALPRLTCASQVLASATQLELNYFGLVAALSSTLLLSSQTIFSKQAMGKVDHLNLLLVTSQMAFVMLIPIWLWHEGWALLFGNRLQELGLSQVQVFTSPPVRRTVLPALLLNLHW